MLFNCYLSLYWLLESISFNWALIIRYTSFNYLYITSIEAYSFIALFYIRSIIIYSSVKLDYISATIMLLWPVKYVIKGNDLPSLFTCQFDDYLFTVVHWIFCDILLLKYGEENTDLRLSYFVARFYIVETLCNILFDIKLITLFTNINWIFHLF